MTMNQLIFHFSKKLREQLDACLPLDSMFATSQDFHFKQFEYMLEINSHEKLKNALSKFINKIYLSPYCSSNSNIVRDYGLISIHNEILIVVTDIIIEVKGNNPKVDFEDENLIKAIAELLASKVQEVRQLNKMVKHQLKHMFVDVLDLCMISKFCENEDTPI